MSDSESRPVLVVGVGSIGERHVRCLLASGRVRVIACEINPTLREKIAQQYDITVHSNLDDALHDQPFAAFIASPANTHIPLSRQLAKAGVHLLIEKPLSTSLEGIDALRQTVRQANLTAGLAYVMRAHPALTAMRRELQSGRFGAPVQVVATCGQHFPTYRPAYREIYYTDRARGGGAIQDALTHTLNAAEWLVGPIERLAADAAHQVLPDVSVEDTVHVIARHGNVLGSYSLNQHQAPNEATTTVVCEKGTLRFESHNRRWRWMTTPESAWQDETFEELERDSLFVLQVEAFLDAIDGRRPLLCPLDEGLQTLAVNLAVLQSAHEQRWTIPSDILTGLSTNA